MEQDQVQEDQEEQEEEMLKEGQRLLKESLLRQKYKNKLEKLWRNFKGNPLEGKVLNIEEIKEMLIENYQMLKLKHRY